MEWTEFLAGLADTHCLSPEQTEAFLIRLQQGNRGESEAKLASELNISAYAFKKRMSGVYEKFTQSCPELSVSENRGKLQKLRAYLTREYTERLHKPLNHSDVSNVVAIQPFQEDINWRDICSKVLAKQREKQLFRRSITGRGLGHEANKVYVKLGLEKQKKQPQRGEDFQPSAERGMLQYRLTEKEIEQEYKYDEFLEQGIEKKEKNFAIVGEPGAGKSTWLEQIALYVDKSEKGFPICISLASLGSKTLEDYLLQIWLEDALPFISPNAVEVTQALKNKLKELFNSGQAWLLLDGVDEMRLGGYESPLQTISNQLRGWVDQARVVLTCRSNVWEANPNVLPNFETYRTLHFDDQQVGDFIDQWFRHEGKPELGEKLQNKLSESGRERIRDLIKNPLRLAMLCGIWYFHQGDLPKTKAALYQQYIDNYFYQWKPHPLLPDDLDKQEELHTALSNLAREALDKRLPLRRKFVHKIIGQSLFQLARDVGWLNLVYKDSETGEDVYAFYHLTFHEYFAACGIDDWDYFLNHNNENPNPFEQHNGKDCVYRIFEPQWKEVFLLWMDQEQVLKDQKNKLLWLLVEFKDGCNNLRIDPPWKELILRYVELENLTQERKDYWLKILVEFNESCNDLCLYWKQAYPLAYEGISHDNIHHDELELGDILYIDEDGATSKIDVVIPEHKKLSLGFPSSLEQFNISAAIYRAIACILIEITPDKLKEVNPLIHLLRTNSTKLNSQTLVESLSIVSQKDNRFLKTVVLSLKNYLESDPEVYYCYYCLLWECAQIMPYPDFYQAWHQTTIHQED
jgi:hypothetical protein